MSVCGLGLAASSLGPLLRALKLQASLTELPISGNRMSDDLLPESAAAGHFRQLHYRGRAGEGC